MKYTVYVFDIHFFFAVQNIHVIEQEEKTAADSQKQGCGKVLGGISNGELIDDETHA